MGGMEGLVSRGVEALADGWREGISIVAIFGV
jgi:hypothetical protein